MTDMRALAAAKLNSAISAEFRPRWRPLPHQIAPTGDWRGWLLMAGRMAGKTDACAHYIAEHVKGPPCLPGPIPHWIGIIAPTLADAATSCYSGPSGLRVHSPEARMVTRAGGLSILWPNGSEAKLFGAHTTDDVERLRSGGNRCVSWLEELAAWKYLDDVYSHMRFGLRVGPHPRWIASTTPKPRPLIKRLAHGEVGNTVVTRASYLDNPYISEEIKRELEEEYGGKQLGRQELYGELIEQDENALWKRSVIDSHRWLEELPKLSRITVGVDPSGGAGEQGIVVGAKAMLPGMGCAGDDLSAQELAHLQMVALQSGHDPLGLLSSKAPLRAHGFVLADYTVNLDPDGWGRRAVQAAIDWEADDIVVEKNYGGQMAIAVVRAAADSMGVPIPVREVTATRGKAIRAQPVAALTEQGRWHHAGNFPDLETQLTTWTPESDWSPDRLDGMVWTGWHNKVVQLTGGTGKTGFGGATRTIA